MTPHSIHSSIQRTLKASPSPVNSISRNCQSRQSIRALPHLTSSYHRKRHCPSTNTIAETHLGGSIKGKSDRSRVVVVVIKAITSKTSSSLAKVHVQANLKAVVLFHASVIPYSADRAYPSQPRQRQPSFYTVASQTTNSSWRRPDSPFTSSTAVAGTDLCST